MLDSGLSLQSNLSETKLKRLGRQCKVDSCCGLQIIVVLLKGTFTSKETFDWRADLQKRCFSLLSNLDKNNLKKVRKVRQGSIVLKPYCIHCCEIIQ